MRNRNGRHVIGRVMLWGEVVECEHGWHAACAYPAHLYVPRVAAVDDPAVEKIAGRSRGLRLPVEYISEDVALEPLAAV
jgi:hypothetical protein